MHRFHGAGSQSGRCLPLVAWRKLNHLGVDGAQKRTLRYLMYVVENTGYFLSSPNHCVTLVCVAFKIGTWAEVNRQ